MHKFVSLFLVLWLQGCAGIWLGSTLSSSYFASNFTSFSDSKEEYLLEREINSKLKALKKVKENIDFDIDITVLKKKIFVIGTAKDETSRKSALDFISSRYSKYNLIDEVNTTFSTNSFIDGLTKFKIKSKLILTNGVRYANYYISVYGGKVVVVGYAVDKYEASLVIDKISQTSGVKSILNYIEIRD
jgi:osmotically-inducible protein OsmY